MIIESSQNNDWPTVLRPAGQIFLSLKYTQIYEHVYPHLLLARSSFGSRARPSSFQEKDTVYLGWKSRYFCHMQGYVFKWFVLYILNSISLCCRLWVIMANSAFFLSVLLLSLTQPASVPSPQSCLTLLDFFDSFVELSHVSHHQVQC